MKYSKSVAETIAGMCVDYTFNRISLQTFIANLRMFADCLEEDYLSEEKKLCGTVPTESVTSPEIDFCPACGTALGVEEA